MLRGIWTSVVMPGMCIDALTPFATWTATLMLIWPGTPIVAPAVLGVAVSICEPLSVRLRKVLIGPAVEKTPPWNGGNTRLTDIDEEVDVPEAMTGTPRGT